MTREIPIPIAVNNRHIHPTRKDAETLFGQNYQFSRDPTAEKYLWPGHELWKEKVTLTGPAGTIPNVSLLGPFSQKTTIEMSTTDAYRLGLNTDLIREKMFGTGVIVTGPKGKFHLTIDQPVNGRWLLTSKSNAEKNGLKDGMSVDVRVGAGTEWATTIHNVRVIVSNEDGKERWAVYLDPDAACAASARPGDTAQILVP